MIVLKGCEQQAFLPASSSLLLAMPHSPARTLMPSRCVTVPSAQFYSTSLPPICLCWCPAFPPLFLPLRFTTLENSAHAEKLLLHKQTLPPEQKEQRDAGLLQRPGKILKLQDKDAVDHDAGVHVLSRDKDDNQTGNDGALDDDDDGVAVFSDDESDDGDNDVDDADADADDDDDDDEEEEEEEEEEDGPDADDYDVYAPIAFPLNGDDDDDDDNADTDDDEDNDGADDYDVYAPTVFPLFNNLSDDIVAKILNKLDLQKKLCTVPLVCRKWYALWRSGSEIWTTIDFIHSSTIDAYKILRKILNLAGPFVREIHIDCMDYDELRNNSVIRRVGHQLEKLTVIVSDMHDKWAIKYAHKLPNLKYLDLSECEDLTEVGIQAFCLPHCPSLTFLRVPAKGIKTGRVRKTMHGINYEVDYRYVSGKGLLGGLRKEEQTRVLHPH
ncbi:hypothetical protein L7F22_023107 [Adiantum nelumboides]|nr:hypothetical protein [Adiantum nelumboides]